MFDGHGGVEAAAYAMAHLHNNMVEQETFVSDADEALCQAFTVTDKRFVSKANNEVSRKRVHITSRQTKRAKEHAEKVNHGSFPANVLLFSEFQAIANMLQKIGSKYTPKTTFSALVHSAQMQNIKHKTLYAINIYLEISFW